MHSVSREIGEKRSEKEISFGSLIIVFINNVIIIILLFIHMRVHAQ